MSGHGDLYGAAFERDTARPAGAWADRGIQVAEGTPAMILLVTRGVPTAPRESRQRCADPYLVRRYSTGTPAIGNYRPTADPADPAAPADASRIGRRMLEPLRPFDLEALLGDPIVRHRRRGGGARPVSRSCPP
ncbi:hypothetical protein OG407_44105 [Streptomyces sp. NBC_01515]|uniref:hypothetical protein n=1 Tax=Streptomyces sp. NBC_01515 TaxID=2903890 RepID=UPI003867947A